MFLRAVGLLFSLLTAARGVADTAISPPQYGPAYGLQLASSVAASGDGYFAVWMDERRGGPASTEILGSRIDANGALLDPYGVRISAEPGGAIPTVVTTPNGYAVFWAAKDYCGRARFLDRDGVPLAPVVAFPCGYMRGLVSIATNGRSFLILNSDGAIVMLDRNLQYLRAMSAASLGGQKTVVTRGTAAASDGENYLIVTVEETGSRIVTYAINDDGQLLDAPAVIGYSAAVAPQLVYTGLDYVLQLTSATGPSLRRIDRKGLGKGAEVSVGVDSTGNQLAGLGDGSVIVVGTTYGPNAQQTTRAVLVTDTVSEPQLLSKTIRYPHLVCNASDCLVMGSVSTYAIYGPTLGGVVTIPIDRRARIRDGSDPAVTRPELTKSATAQQNFAALRDQPSRLIAWEELDGNARSVIMIRDLQNPSDAGRVVFAEANANQHAPALATNGSVNLLSWYSIDRTDGAMTARAVRLSSDGVPIDSQPITLGSSLAINTLDTPDAAYTISPAAVAWSGSLFFVAFPGKDFYLHVAKVSAGGALIDAGSMAAFPPLQEREFQTYPVLTPAGDEVFLLWQEGIKPYQCMIECPIPRPSVVRMARLSPDGLPLDALPTVVDGNVALTPDAAWNGWGLLAVWQRDETLWGRFFGHDGGPTTPVFSLGRSLEHFPPSVIARQDGGFDVAWILDFDPLSWYGGVVASRIGPSGPSHVVFLSETLDQRTPRLWRLPSGQTAVAYQRVSEDPAVMLVPRIRYSPLDPLGPRKHAVGR